MHSDTDEFGTNRSPPEAEAPRRRRMAVRLVILFIAIGGAAWWLKGNWRLNWGPGASVRALNEAIDAGDTAKLKRILAAGADPDEVDDFGRTPLHRAAAFGDREAVRALVPAVRRIDAEDRGRMTPLLFAVGGGHVEALAILLEAGANPNGSGRNAIPPLRWLLSPPERLAVPTRYPFGGRDWRPGLDDEKRIAMISSFKAANADFNHVGGRDGVLHFAIADASDGVLEAFHQAGADPGVRNAERRLPLHEAVTARRADRVRWLVAKGARPNETDAAGLTPLHLAMETLDLSLVNALLEVGAKLDLLDGSLRTPLRIALSASPTGKSDAVVNARRRAMLERLIKAGADPNGAWRPILRIDRTGRCRRVLVAPMSLDRPSYGWNAPPTPASDAVDAGPDCLGVWLNAGGIPDAIDRSGDPYSALSRSSTPESVALLLDHRADPDLRDSSGHVPLFKAIKEGRFAVANLLLDRGADPFQRTNDGLTLMDALADSSLGIISTPGRNDPPVDKPKKLNDWFELARRLVAAGVSVHPADPPHELRERFQRRAFPGRPFVSAPLHRSAANQQLSVKAMEELVRLGARPSDGDRIWNETPLFHATTPEKIAWLIRAGNRVDHRNRVGGTALIGSQAQFSSSGHPRICALIDAGADPNARDHHGRSLWTELRNPGDAKPLLEFLADRGLVPPAAPLGSRERIPSGFVEREFWPDYSPCPRTGLVEYGRYRFNRFAP